jgi:hypothetical protein
MKTSAEIEQRIASLEAQAEAATEAMNMLSSEVEAKAQNLGVDDLLRPDFREEMEAMEKTMAEHLGALYVLIASLEQLYWVAEMDGDFLDLQTQKLMAQNLGE